MAHKTKENMPDYLTKTQGWDNDKRKKNKWEDNNNARALRKQK